jgi:NAD kinase
MSSQHASPARHGSSSASATHAQAQPGLARAVIVTRRSELEVMLERHGTFGQAEFFLASRGDSIAPYVEAHERLRSVCRSVDGILPPEQRRARVDRDDLERFLFAPDDLIIIIGQDGLVPNVAKYLREQLVIAINPDPLRYDGVLCRHSLETFPRIVAWLNRPSDAYAIQKRPLAHAQQSDGQRILALNEVFVGHRTHQSARYRISTGDAAERHSSSGLICSTGTGCTGWARSIMLQRALEFTLPGPEDRRLAWFVREPFPSVTTQTSLSFGLLSETERLTITSEMGDGGVVFGDGIETDRIDFVAGSTLKLSIAEHALRLVVPGKVAASLEVDTNTKQRRKRSQRQEASK